MKKLLESPVFAVFLAAVVVIGTTLLSTKIGFGGKCDAMKETFYRQTDDALPVASGLRSFCDAAEKVALTAQENEVRGAEDVLSNIKYLKNMLYLESDNYTVMRSVYQDLLSDTFSLEAALARMELAEAETETLSSAQHGAAEAKAAVDASEFNSLARAFLKRYQKFPTEGLAALTGLSMPCAFD